MRNVTYISAGAGSGKTYCLTDRLASILSEGRIRGENILMTTFTDLAAGELKKKAKAKLYSKGMVKESEEVDMATIGTIHNKEVLKDDGTREIRKMVDVGITMDERIADGMYFARSIKVLQQILSKPELLDIPMRDPIEL